MAVPASLRHADLVAVKCIARSGVARSYGGSCFNSFVFFSQESAHRFSQWLHSSHSSSTEGFLPSPHSCHPVLSFVFLMLATLPNVGRLGK